MHRAQINGKIQRKKGTIHCAPTIQIKTINLYFRTNDKTGERELFEILRPKVYVNSICNIDLKKLKKIKKIKGIIVDLDNTLVAWGEKEVSQKIIDWVKEAKRLEFKLCIVSNTNSKRVAEIAKIFNIPYHSKYFKPF
ncbi:hypothetical protein KJ599_06220, partial [bacterium]|nr:hypothetical protein [bacterium]